MYFAENKRFLQRQVMLKCWANPDCAKDPTAVGATTLNIRSHSSHILSGPLCKPLGPFRPFPRKKNEH